MVFFLLGNERMLYEIVLYFFEENFQPITHLTKDVALVKSMGVVN